MRFRPALLVVSSFLFLILVGTAVLMVFGFDRLATADRVLPSLFTSVSAVCVTGLSIVNLSKDMDFTGQLIVLILIQAGGLGILTLSNWVLFSLRGRIGLHGSLMTVETVGSLPRVPASSLVRGVVLYTATCESVGAILLFLRFVRDFPAGKALWLGIFHSVSAFCNAGFSLFGDSLVGYRHDIFVNVPVMLLVVCGGIGFVVATDVAAHLAARARRARVRLTTHTRVVVTTTLILIASGAALIMAFEWKNVLATEALGGEVLQALFLSVTARTAGFNTVGTGQLTNMSLVVVMILMVIGASPGSTGGGIKTTSAVVLWALVRGHLLNRPRVEIAGRSLARETVAKSLVLIVLYGCIVVLGMVALQATEFGQLPHDETRGMFLEHLFEVVSALSTVGLSTGATARLSGGGLHVLMALMFIGRVGPLVLATSLIGERRRLAFNLPEADLMVG